MSMRLSTSLCVRGSFGQSAHLAAAQQHHHTCPRCSLFSLTMKVFVQPLPALAAVLLQACSPNSKLTIGPTCAMPTCVRNFQCQHTSKGNKHTHIHMRARFHQMCLCYPGMLQRFLAHACECRTFRWPRSSAKPPSPSLQLLCP